MDAIEILKQLKNKGVRFTPQRQAILEFLLETVSHPTADEIYHHVKAKFPGVSLGTIYNTLNMLKEHGHLLELSYGDMSSRFDGNPENHYHIVCSRCGKVADLHRPLIDMDQEVGEQSGFQVLGHRMEFHGVCPECLKGVQLN
ncbi:Fur family transcriptional regulator [Desulfosporosinus sp. BICA1-9]|uniref:Fur family transcriptional regulator n=1 Tax=Desulfosporosinus sp. BICA1-9 TaxID=1531958 RepID=UPI00054B66F1|nr:transcriptional repressor [Desulfosporosinus sp. BICA1-9]KJS48074.1 MAG: peptide ABC transporter substrate-binding protein [Peptococcaceae bacterium BRH_c23]KJS78484.1 MAG: peptide ABC transporter substrate-binding protein [Desulfosporosinus sp. BICA1-9]KJS79382.1 MAG: peptide ABC transporter substrate-binding protein [Desulfosporosinus sp. BICA1-9]HBW36092.1 transcriptional repressor [Desulfosporosinus sp.]